MMIYYKNIVDTFRQNMSSIRILLLAKDACMYVRIAIVRTVRVSRAHVFGMTRRYYHYKFTFQFMRIPLSERCALYNRNKRMPLSSFSKWHFIPVFMLLVINVLHAEIPPKFLNLSVQQGLSQNSVWSILRDKQGFLWFATNDGLNKYDGYRFFVYRHKRKDSTSISANAVHTLIQDRTGRMWLGTSGGLNIFDPATNRFSVYRSEGERAEGLTDKNITGIVEDTRGSIWVATEHDGLYQIDPSTNTHRWFTNGRAGKKGPSTSSITSLYVDRAGTLWIGTLGGGVNKYDASSGTFTVFRNDPMVRGSLVDNTVYAFFEDVQGRFWIGTLSHGIASLNRTTGQCVNYPAGAAPVSGAADSMTVYTIAEDTLGTIIYGTFGGGLKFLDPSTGAITSWKRDIRDPNSIAGNEIVSLYQDNVGKLWIGTFSSGISQFDPNGEHFHTYRNETPRFDLLSDNNIRCLYRETKGPIWVGTQKGLDVFDPVSRRSEHYNQVPGDRFSLADNYVRAVFKDSRETYWIATRKGLSTFHRAAKRFYPCTDKDTIVNSLLHADIRAIIEDRNGMMWFGTSLGLCSFDRGTNEYIAYTPGKSDPRKVSSGNIRSLFEDHTGTLWIGIYGAGITKFDRATGIFKKFSHDAGDPNSLNNDFASPIVEDHAGNLWIGTYGGGINKFDPRTQKFTAFTESEGLINNTVFGVLVDGAGKLWISTFSGMSSLDPVSHKFRNFTSASGLQSEEFNLNCSFLDNDGTMFFGGHGGINYFRPDKIRENSFVPPVYITSMSIFNTPAHWDTAMTMKKHIVLPHDENSFSFDFVALNFRKPELNRYKYKLEGFDSEWSPAETERKASYTNLLPGEYVFRVIASNNDDVWNTAGASVVITIRPPFWKTWSAYLFYMVGIVTAAFGTVRVVRQRQRTKLFIERQQFEKERLEKINTEIAQQRILLRTVIDNIPMAVYAKDAHARKVIANFVDLAALDKPENEVLGRTDVDLLPGDAAERSMADDLSVILTGTSVVEREELVVNTRGESRTLLTSKIPWRDKEGTIVGLVGIALDITDRKRLEQQLLQSQKLEGVGTLAGGIAHDFNNLLAMVLGSAELLKRQLSDHPELQKYVGRIIEASERGTSISRQLLIFSRPEAAVLKPISLSHTITELKEMLKHFLPKSISIETEINVLNGIIMGDTGQIHQALLNLALNAGDAMKNSGRLTISEFTVAHEVMKKRFSLDHDASYIAVSVADTGVGMDEKTRLRIFDPFFTTKAPGKGTGLGLGIVHGIVKNHNGLIFVESTLGHGTTFTLYFPSVPQQEFTMIPAGSDPAQRQTGTILVVDDEQLLRDMLFEVLSDSGYTVSLAANGTEALEYFTLHHDAIDLVITDLGMPEMGGEELYRRLRGIDDAVKVIVSSGYLDGTTKESLMQMGIKHVLIKPFKMLDIQSAIMSVLHHG